MNDDPVRNVDKSIILYSRSKLILFQRTRSYSNTYFYNMDINFEYDNVNASERLEALATEKINKLVNKYDFMIRADVFFKTENTSSDDTGMICNIRISAPGPRLFAEASHSSFEASIKESVNDLDRQLKKRKEKMKSH